MSSFTYILVVMIMFADGSTASRIVGADSLDACRQAAPGFARRYSDASPEPRGARMLGWACIKLTPAHQAWLTPDRSGRGGNGHYQKETVK